MVYNKLYLCEIGFFGCNLHKCFFVFIVLEIVISQLNVESNLIKYNDTSTIIYTNLKSYLILLFLSRVLILQAFASDTSWKSL